MKHFSSKIVSKHALVNPHDIELFEKYIQRNSFQGFYYDSDDKSYGIALSFLEKNEYSFILCAQVSKSGEVLARYRIHAGWYSIEQVAYDKVLIFTQTYKKELLHPASGFLNIPEKIEFTLQVLTRNSIYLRFLNHELYTPPINSFQGGLILSCDRQHDYQNLSKIIVESDIW